MRGRRRLALAAAGAALLPIALSGPGSAAAATTTAVAAGDDVEYEVLPAVTQDPLGITVAPDGRVIWTEREGTLNVLTPGGQQVLAGHIPVSAAAYAGAPCATCTQPETKSLEEGGLYSVLLAKDFEKSGRLYLYRPIPGSENTATGMGYWRLSTFVLDKTTNLLDMNSEKKILEVPAEWEHCCHYGGDLNYLPDGTILL